MSSCGYSNGTLAYFAATTTTRGYFYDQGEVNAARRNASLVSAPPSPPPAPDGASSGCRVVDVRLTLSQCRGAGLPLHMSALSGSVASSTNKWPSTQGQWMWVVDSGAEMNVTGSFIYPNSYVLDRAPKVQIRGVDGGLTQVDAIVRTMLVLPDGDHAMMEVLVCNDFKVALWGVPYMVEFGFRTVLDKVGSTSTIRTPTGFEVELLNRPATS